MKNLTQQIIDQFHTVEKEKSKLKSLILDYLILNHPESSKPAISSVRTMDSMKMIEEILDSPKSTPKTLNFVSGLEEFLETRGHLSESQRSHLESTYHSIFGDSQR